MCAASLHGYVCVWLGLWYYWHLWFRIKVRYVFLSPSAQAKTQTWCNDSDPMVCKMCSRVRTKSEFPCVELLTKPSTGNSDLFREIVLNIDHWSWSAKICKNKLSVSFTFSTFLQHHIKRSRFVKSFKVTNHQSAEDWPHLLPWLSLVMTKSSWTSHPLRNMHRSASFCF